MFHCFQPLVLTVLPLWQRPLADSFAPPAFTGFVANMGQSDSWRVICFPPLLWELKVAYRFRNASGLPGMHTVPCELATLSAPGGTYAFLPIVCALLPAVTNTTSASALYELRGSIASRFRIAALALLCLRLNPTSRLRIQGWVPAACRALPVREFHPTILCTPNRRTFEIIIIHQIRLWSNEL